MKKLRFFPESIRKKLAGLTKTQQQILIVILIFVNIGIYALLIIFIWRLLTAPYTPKEPVLIVPTIIEGIPELPEQVIEDLTVPE